MVFFFEDLGRATRTVGTEGGAGDLGELLARLHVLDYRLIEPGQVLVPVLRSWKGNGRRGQRLVLGGWMPQKVPVQIWADARRAGARSRATTAPDAGTAVDTRRDDCIDCARQLVERGDGPMGPGNPLGGRRRRVKGTPARHPVFAPRGASAGRGRDLREGPHLEHGLKAVRHTSHDDRMSLSSFDLLSLAAERSRRLGEWPRAWAGRSFLN